MTDEISKRTEQVASCFGQGINPSGNVRDYADLDEDYSQEETDAANGVGDPETYYDSYNSADNEITIK